MPRKDIHKDGKSTQFQKGNTASVGKGRPKKYFKKFAEENGLSGYNGNEIRDSFSIIAEMTEEQIKGVLEDSSADILLQSVCRSFLKAKAKGDFNQIKNIVELIGGKAIMRVAQTDTNGENTPPTEEGMLKRLKELNEKKRDIKKARRRSKD